ncbi:MAG: MFS transporter [Chloroflexi bacterium]|nr:MFS transporter [Chloroflexota bacterium]
MRLSLDPVGVVARSPNYRWWAFASIGLGLFLVVADQSGINIALPSIAEEFGADLPTAQWIALGYILVTSIMYMPVGRLSDIVGRKAVYMGGFVVFVAGALVGGTAEAFPVIVVAKLVQGVGVAGIEANGMAMVADIFPERERGKALGLYMSIIGAGAIGGPSIGGLLVSTLGWRSVFLTGAALGVAAMIFAALVLHARVGAKDAGPVRFDWVGAGISAAALIIFLMAITNAHSVGWGSPAILAGFAVALFLLAAFVWWEGRIKDPMLDLQFFSSRVFSLGVSARFLSFMGMSSVFFLLPFYLVQALGMEPSKAGLLMIPGSISIAVFGPISGRLSDSIGTRWLTVAGMALSGVGFLMFSRLTVDSTSGYIIAGMLVHGIGVGLFSSPNTSAILTAVPNEKFSSVSAFLNLTRTSANLAGIAATTAIVTSVMAAVGFESSLAAVTQDGGEGIKQAFVAGMGRAYLVAAGLLFLSMTISAFRGENPASTSQA